MTPIDRTPTGVSALPTRDPAAPEVIAPTAPEVIAPTEAEWLRLSAAEQDAVERSLPFVVEHDFMSEGDIHGGTVLDATEALSIHFGSGGGGPGKRRFYIGRSVMVHYPGVAGFAPDFFVVFDVDGRPRDTWFVSREGRGLDIAFEVIWKGDAAKDYERNVQRYSELGIPEYFIFDVAHQRIAGFRLDDSGAYRPILGQLGRYESKVLGLSIAIRQRQFRFFSGQAPLPTRSELIAGLEEAANLEAEARSAAEARAQAESERAQAEAERAAVAEARVRELEALLATLREPSDA